MPNIDYLLGKKIMPQQLAAWCQKAMEKSGLNESDAVIAADVFVSADTRGVFSHGSRQIFPLMKNVKNGRIDPQAVPAPLVNQLSVALLDGRNAMPTTIAVEAMMLAIEKARKTGMGYVSVRRSSHIGALGYYPLMAAK